jgi:hypothetical protein
MWHTNPVFTYHPRIGYKFTANLRTRFPEQRGGFLVRTNAAGFRSDREFEKERPPGVYRALLFGDSQTAAHGVINHHRYSDRLEALIPGLEIYNYAVDSVSPDQEYLIYKEYGNVEHDLVIIGLYVDDVIRVVSRYRKFTDAKGKIVYFAKPYYELKGGKLVLGNIPVPKQPFDAPPDSAETPEEGRTYSRVRDVFHTIVPVPAARRFLKSLGVHRLVEKAGILPRVQEYKAADEPGWRLLAEILKLWIRESPTPVLLVPIPIWTFIDGSDDATGYRTRIRELAESTGCVSHDPLPDLRSYPASELKKFFASNAHLSPLGHDALAKSLKPVIERLMSEARPRMQREAEASQSARAGAGA